MANKQNPYVLSWLFSVIGADGSPQRPHVSLCFPWGRPEELCRRLPAVAKLWVIRRSALIPRPLCSAGGGGTGWSKADKYTSVQTEPAVLMHPWVPQVSLDKTLNPQMLPNDAPTSTLVAHCHQCVSVRVWMRDIHINAAIYVPGFGPSIPQQLKDGRLFGGEVSPQEVDSIFGKVRGDHWTHQFRTSTALQHLWTHTEVYWVTTHEWFLTIC